MKRDLSILGRCSIEGSSTVLQISDFLIFLQAAIEMFIRVQYRKIMAVDLNRSLLLTCLSIPLSEKSKN